MPAQVPVDLDAVEERLTPRFTARSLTALALGAAVGFVAAQMTHALPAGVRAAVCAPAAALTWSALAARWQGAYTSQWAARVARFAVSPHRMAPVPAVPSPAGRRARP